MLNLDSRGIFFSGIEIVILSFFILHNQQNFYTQKIQNSSYFQTEISQLGTSFGEIQSKYIITQNNLLNQKFYVDNKIVQKIQKLPNFRQKHSQNIEINNIKLITSKK